LARLDSFRDAVAELPPFPTLSPESRRAIVRAIAAEDRWRMAGYELGKTHARASRAIRALATKARERPGSELLRLLVSAIQSGPARCVHGIYRASRWAARPLSRDASFLGSLARSGVRPWDLAVRYAQEIPQAPGHRGYWHDRDRHQTVGMVLGIDFIPHAEGHWFVESNLDAALRDERSALYDRDPFLANLVDFAASHGYQRLMVIPGNTVALDRRMFERLGQEAEARGLEVTVVEDKFLPGARSPRSLSIPPLGASTFVARIRRYHTALDHLVADKGATHRALSLHLRETGDRSFRLPRTGSLDEVFRPAGDEPLPNLVYKYAELDQGQAVAFLKARSVDRARSIVAQAAASARPGGLAPVLASRIGRRTGLLQEFVASAPAAGRRLFILRAHVLISPAGTRFLSAHRVVAGAPLPETLAEGVVADPRPFLVNYSAGARYEAASPDDEESVSRAVLGVAAAISRAVEIGFDVGSPAESGSLRRTNERKT
jgi:hypothetical protein